MDNKQDVRIVMQQAQIFIFPHPLSIATFHPDSARVRVLGGWLPVGCSPWSYTITWGALSTPGPTFMIAVPRDTKYFHICLSIYAIYVAIMSVPPFRVTLNYAIISTVVRNSGPMHLLLTTNVFIFSSLAVAWPYLWPHWWRHVMFFQRGFNFIWWKNTVGWMGLFLFHVLCKMEVSFPTENED